MIALAQGGMELDVAPEIGGSVTRLAFEGTDVLRPAPKGAFVQCNACTFALVPYANRIENGVFHFRGREIRLSRNFGDHPHSLHGHGWQTAWRVASLSRDQVTLAYDYEAADWPWTYSAEQVLTLADGGFTHRLTVRSRDAKAMPASLGFHPYFPCTATTRLTATVAGMWKADSTMIPTDHVEGSPLLDLAHGALVAKAPFVDNCFTGWRSPARIDQPDSGLTISLEASPECTFFHIFIPVGQRFFAAEPVSVMPNAFNRPEPASITGARTLGPGESFSIEMRIAVRRH
ncbi:MAG: aldose 1-epimerase [Rhizomicrobium sp.]